MGHLVYILCTATSLVCTLLLARAYTRTHARLLYWSALCFAGLTATNLLVFLDLTVFLQVDLLPIRNGMTLASLGALIYGIIFESS